MESQVQSPPKRYPQLQPTGTVSSGQQQWIFQGTIDPRVILMLCVVCEHINTFRLRVTSTLFVAVVSSPANCTYPTCFTSNYPASYPLQEAHPGGERRRGLAHWSSSEGTTAVILDSNFWEIYVACLPLFDMVNSTFNTRHGYAMHRPPFLWRLLRE
jgi:hypothetical protein